MANKITYVEVLTAVVNGETLSKEQIEKVKALIVQMNKKNKSDKPTKTQVENEKIKASIIDAMEVGKAYTVAEVMALANIETNQKCSALLRQMVTDGLVTREEIKRKPYFSVVASDEDATEVEE